MTAAGALRGINVVRACLAWTLFHKSGSWRKDWYRPSATIPSRACCDMSASDNAKARQLEANTREISVRARDRLPTMNVCSQCGWLLAVQMRPCVSEVCAVPYSTVPSRVW